MRKLAKNLTVAMLATGIASPALAANVVPANWSVISTVGVIGTLRAGSPWGPGSTPASQISIVDGNFAPAAQQWNNGSLWWDEDPSVNSGTVYTTLTLNNSFTLDRFVVQADDNDSYLLEYWTGSAWATLWNIAAVGGSGLQTRDSGILSAITTNQLRFSATSGDGYYAISELQAFSAGAVPEAASWAMMITGLGIAGFALRRRQRTTVRFQRV